MGDRVRQALNHTTEAGIGDADKVKKLQNNIKELEHYAKQLQEQNATIKQANAELANEAKQKNEIALERDGLKQALDQARKSGNGGNDIETMQKKVYDLEQFSHHLHDQYDPVKQANADL